METSRCPQCRGKSYLVEKRGDACAARVCDCAKTCRHCGGSGYLLSTHQEEYSKKVGPKRYEVLAPCPCRLLARRVTLFSNAGIPGVLASAAFDNFRPMSDSQDKAKKAATAFALKYSRKNPVRGFVLSGPVGAGKTHLLAATLSHLVLEVGVPASYVEISLLYAQIRRGFQLGKSGGEIIGPLAEVEVLAIDELGKGRGSQFELETLDELIARRYNAGRTTLFATNFSLEPDRRSAQPRGYKSTEELKASAKEAETLRERVGERIYSRLCEMCEFVELPADTPDQRRMKQELSAAGSGRASR